MKYKFIQSYMQFKKDDIVYEFNGHTFGILRDDEEMLGVPCIAVCLEGETSFTVVPRYTLESVSEKHTERYPRGWHPDTDY